MGPLQMQFAASVWCRSVRCDWHSNNDGNTGTGHVSGGRIQSCQADPCPPKRASSCMAHWQSIRFECAAQRPARDYMDLRFVKEVMAELGKEMRYFHESGKNVSFSH